MQRQRLLWQVFLPALVVLVASAVVLTVLASWTLREVSLDTIRADLQSQARLVELLLESTPGSSTKRWAPAVRNAAVRTGARITIVAADGRVLADSAADPAAMPNHSDRPEIAAALRGELGVSHRWSATIGKDSIYVALPASEQLGGALIRASRPYDAAGAMAAPFSGRMISGAIVIAALAATMALLATQRATRPLADLENAAKRLAEGDLSFQAPVTGSGETAELARTMNRMARQLDERFRVIAEQRNEQQVVLSSMVEGVLALDNDERVSTINRAAGRLLSLEPHQAIGRSIQEISRNPDVHRFVSAAGRSDELLEAELTLHGPEPRALQAHGARIVDVRGTRIGTVVVLNDVTKLRKLEQIRREFVANVSHELKTPITSIKGFVATLQDGAIENPTDAVRFLEIIARHTERLSAIVDDLLSLSRIEQEHRDGALATTTVSLHTVLARAVDATDGLARERNATVQIDCDSALQVDCDERLLEQAVENLVENAVKYGDAGATVQVRGRARGDAILIEVEDRGWGIAPEHLDRLFERFYRVDNARSRKLGGTGLGLAIVKHIALAHGGKVTVESTPGRGSTFTLTLPRGALA